MKLEWYGHSCFRISGAEGSVVFDPYSPGSVPGLELPELEADAVICSHGHSDHNYSEGVKLSGGRFTGNVAEIRTYHDECRGKKRGENTVTLVECDGLRAVHMGDIGCPLSPEQIKELGRVDLLMIPVGGYYTVEAAQAWEIAKALSPRFIVPMHYRGEGFGYGVISTVEPFLKLAGNVKKLEGAACEIELADAPATLLFSLR